jgi:transcriptional antiterminator RfaH
MLKLSDNPPMLHPTAASLRDLPGDWFVAHTKARNEKAFAWDLVHREIPYFLPMMKRVRFSGGRKRRLLLPLFSSYVFICGDDQTRIAAMSTDRLCQVIAVHDQTTFVNELASIERALAGDAEFDPYPHAAVGKRCRVRSGPLQGVEGIVVMRTTGPAGAASLVLQVSMLGVGAAVQIDPDLLESAQ